MIARLRNAGPGALVTAAFIGPGTVTACTLAGVNFGYALLWALLFATISTIILQEMSARLGVVTQKGLGDALAELFDASALKWPLILLVGTALYLGNAAYEAGNLSGAALGIAALVGESDLAFKGAVILIAVLAAALLVSGSYKAIERVLLALGPARGTDDYRDEREEDQQNQEDGERHEEARQAPDGATDHAGQDQGDETDQNGPDGVRHPTKRVQAAQTVKPTLQFGRPDAGSTLEDREGGAGGVGQYR